MPSEPPAVVEPLPASARAEAIALWQRAGLTRPWNDPGVDFDLALAGPASTVLGIRRQGVLAAAVVVGHDGHRGAIYYLAVDPACQRRGLGRQLVEAAEAWCRRAGIHKLNLLVRRENAAVQAFYAALGYRDTQCTSLYRTLDDSVADREIAQKAAWAARLA